MDPAPGRLQSLYRRIAPLSWQPARTQAGAALKGSLLQTGEGKKPEQPSPHASRQQTRQRLSGVSLGPPEPTAPGKFPQHPMRFPHSADQSQVLGPCTCPATHLCEYHGWVPGPMSPCDPLPTLDSDRHSVRTGNNPQGPPLLAPALLVSVCVLVCDLVKTTGGDRQNHSFHGRRNMPTSQL